MDTSLRPKQPPLRGYRNPNLQRQGEKSRALAAERSDEKTASANPLTYGFMSGLMGNDYGSSPLSVLDPKRAKSQTAQDIGMAIGTTLEALPAIAALRKPIAKAGKALGKSALEAVNDANLYGEGPLSYFTPQVKAITPNAPKPNPPPSNSSRHGKGWWYNTKNNVFMEIDSGSLGPNGDHDGWISVGDNAAKLGVDPAVALRFQEGSFGFMASKDDIQKAIKRGEIQAKDVGKDGEYYYNPNVGMDEVPTFNEAFEKKHGVSMEEAGFSGMPEELSSLVRIRQWPNGRISYSLQKDPNPKELQGIVNTMDKIPGFWKAPKVLALLDDGASMYTLSPENFSRVRNLKDLPRFNDDVLAKSSEVIPPLQQVAPPTPAPPTDPFWFNSKSGAHEPMGVEDIHAQKIQDPEYASRLGVTPEQATAYPLAPEAESLITGRQTGNRLSLVGMGTPTDETLTATQKMLQEKQYAPEVLDFGGGERLWENMSPEDLLKAKTLEDLEPFKKYKAGGEVKISRYSKQHIARDYASRKK
jgi:hypothetical protein